SGGDNCERSVDELAGARAIFFFACRHRLDLHSFPTRRSSDLGQARSLSDGRAILKLFLSIAYRSPSPIDQSECALFEGSPRIPPDRKSTRLNSSHVAISYAVFCLKKKRQTKPNKYPKTPHQIP